jgi:4-hydroxythreonine-4-phosphate dehydrogenase
MNDKIKPTIAITMGDPAGIGPELVVKVLSQANVHDDCHPFVIGDAEVMTAASGIVGSALRFRRIERLSEARFSPLAIDVLHPLELHIDHVNRSKVDPAMGQAVALCLKKAFELAMDGQVHGVYRRRSIKKPSTSPAINISTNWATWLILLPARKPSPWV